MSRESVKQYKADLACCPWNDLENMMIAIDQPYVVSYDSEIWQNSHCTCYYGQKEYKCYHSIIVTHKVGDFSFQNTILKQPLRAKDPRGRKNNMPVNCLSKSSESVLLYKTVLTASELVVAQRRKLAYKRQNLHLKK